MRQEDGVRLALEAGKDVGAEVLVFLLEALPVRLLPRGGGGLTLTGQMKYFERAMRFTSSMAQMTVMIQAPTKPSTVFLGLSLMSWVRPKAMPQM